MQSSKFYGAFIVLSLTHFDLSPSSYGLGANIALDDVLILSDALNSTHDLPNAVQKFTK